MKKLLLIFSVAGALFLTSCGDNENTVNPQPLGTATISGIVYADLDETNEEFEIVANKKVLAKIYDRYSEGAFRIIETTTDENGSYSFQIEVGHYGADVLIQLIDFRAPVKKEGGENEEEIFVEGEESEVNDVVKGGEYIRDLYYSKLI